MPRVTERAVKAAQLRMRLDEQDGRDTPDDVVRIANARRREPDAEGPPRDVALYEVDVNAMQESVRRSLSDPPVELVEEIERRFNIRLGVEPTFTVTKAELAETVRRVLAEPQVHKSQALWTAQGPSVREEHAEQMSERVHREDDASAR